MEKQIVLQMAEITMKESIKRLTLLLEKSLSIWWEMETVLM